MTLRRLARSTPIAVVAVTAMFHLACSLPSVKPRMAADFTEGKTRVKRVAILPVDISLHVEGDDHVAREDVALGEQTIERVQRGIAASLRRRGYQVSAVLDAGGCDRPRGNTKTLVIHPTDLAALRVEIHQGTSFQSRGPGYIEARVSADLTRQIQSVTGADASLYARGWIYVGKEQSAAVTALKIVGFTLMIVLVVGLMVAMFAGGGKGGKSKSKSSSSLRASRQRSRSHAFRSSGRRRAGPRLAGGRAFLRATRAMVRAAAAVGEVMIYTAPDAPEAPRKPIDDVIECHSCEPPLPPAVQRAQDEPGAPPEALPAPPVARPTRALPPSKLVLHDQGKVPDRSTVGLAVSLVQNSSGRVLWHGKQDFQVKVDGSYNVERLIEHFFQELPAAR